MEIGKKLKTARTAAGLTQEQVAQQLFVSRQTVSNWENERTYPDIVSVIRLSDLYSISLDELLKGDTEMLEHFKESTDIVQSNRRLVLAVALNIIVLLACLTAAAFLPESILFIVCVFCLAVVSVAYLLYQIVKRI